MNSSDEFIDYVTALLSPLGELQQRKFFGGYAFKHEDKQFAMIMGNTLFLCVNDNTRPRYQNYGMQPFSYHTRKGQVIVQKYYSAPAFLFDNQDEFFEWANQAIEVAHSYC